MASGKTAKRNAGRQKKVQNRIARAAGDLKKLVRRKQKLRVKKGV